MTNPLVLTTVIDDQSIDVTVPASTINVTTTTGTPVLATVVDDQSVSVSVTPAPVVDVSAISQPFTIVTVEGPAGPTGPAGDGAFIAREIPTGTVDGNRTIFTLAHNFQAGSTSVYLNGLLEYFCNELSTNQIQFTDPPQPGDVIRVSYTVSS